MHILPFETFFHEKSSFLLIFERNLLWNKFRDCTAQYCSDLPSHSHYEPIVLNPLFYHHVETVFFSVSCYWNGHAANSIKKLPIRSSKKISLPFTMQTQPILINHYQWTHLFYNQLSRLFFSWTIWNRFMMVLLKFLTSLRKSRINVRHKTGKHFTLIETIWFIFTQKKVCFFPILKYTMNEILYHFIFVIHQTCCKKINKRHMASPKKMVPSFKDDPLASDYCDASIMSDIELFKFISLDGDYH